MNTVPDMDLTTRQTLAHLIPTDEWCLPDLARFGVALPGRGSTDRGVPYRLRAALRLQGVDIGGVDRVGTVRMDRCDDIGCTIVRVNARGDCGDRFHWRRFGRLDTEAHILAMADQLLAQTYQKQPRKATIKSAAVDAPAATPVTPPALPLRPASTSISRMPTLELQRLCADGRDELARRGELPDPEPATLVTPAPLTDEIAWSHLRARLSAGISPEMLRRIAADSAAAVQRQREAAQAAIEAAQAAMAAAQAELARLG